MLKLPFVLALALVLGACSATLVGYDTGLLYGSDWMLHAIDGHDVMDGSRADLIIASDGTFHGNASCNAMGGKVTVVDHKITFSPAFTTKMACTPSGTMEQEDRYLATLRQVAAWRLAGHVLYLNNANGTQILRFGLAHP